MAYCKLTTYPSLLVSLSNNNLLTTIRILFDLRHTILNRDQIITQIFINRIVNPSKFTLRHLDISLLIPLYFSSNPTLQCPSSVLIFQLSM